MLAKLPARVARAGCRQGVGDGESVDPTAADALAIAHYADPHTPQQADVHDPQGLAPGQNVSSAPTHNPGNDARVRGMVCSVDHKRMACEREHIVCGRVAVHFLPDSCRVEPL